MSRVVDAVEMAAEVLTLLILLLELFIILSAVPALAETVGEQTVAQFRQQVQADSSGWYLPAFSRGAMLGAAPFMDGCRDHSVGELGAFLRYTAKPDTPLWAAVLQFFMLEKDCHRMSDAEARQVWRKGDTP